MPDWLAPQSVARSPTHKRSVPASARSTTNRSSWPMARNNPNAFRRSTAGGICVISLPRHEPRTIDLVARITFARFDLQRGVLDAEIFVQHFFRAFQHFEGRGVGLWNQVRGHDGLPAAQRPNVELVHTRNTFDRRELG